MRKRMREEVEVGASRMDESWILVERERERGRVVVVVGLGWGGGG